jgi:hypothetical protein
MTNIPLKALSCKRAELVADVMRCQAKLQQLAIDLEHIDGAMRIIAPDYVSESKLVDIFAPSAGKRGETVRSVLGILRVARAPMTSREIAAQLFVQRGQAPDDNAMSVMARRVGACLKDKRKRGTVRAVGQDGISLRWEIAR